MNPLPVSVSGEPAGPAAALRLTLPWVVGVGTGVGVGVAVGVGLGEGDGDAGAGAAATEAIQATARVTTHLLILILGATVQTRACPPLSGPAACTPR